MTHTRAIQFAILFWSLLILAHPVKAGSGGEEALKFCGQTADVVRDSNGQSMDSLRASFENWLSNAPAHNPCYDFWCADMTREMIRSAYAQDGQHLILDSAWREKAIERCMAWSRGEVRAN